MKTGETQNAPTPPPRSLRIFAWLFRLLGVIIAVIASVAAFLVFSPSGYLLSAGLAVVAVLGLVFGLGMGWWMEKLCNKALKETYNESAELSVSPNNNLSTKMAADSSYDFIESNAFNDNHS